MSQTESNLDYFLQEDHLDNAYILRDILSGLEQEVWEAFELLLREKMMKAARDLRDWEFYEATGKDNEYYEPYFSSSLSHPLGHQLYVGASIRTYFSAPEEGRTGVFFIVQKDGWKKKGDLENGGCTSAEAKNIHKLILNKHPDLGEWPEDNTEDGYTLFNTNSGFVFDCKADFFRKIAKEEGRKLADSIVSKVVSIIHTLEENKLSPAKNKK